MWPADNTSQCPKCGELTYEYDRHFPDLFKFSRDVYFPVIAYYCAACDHIVVEAYHSKTDRDVFVCAHDSDWRIPSGPSPPRAHPAYDRERISYRTMLAHSGLEFRRAVRQSIGPIVRADDPEIEVSMPMPVEIDTEAMRKTFDGWLRNSKSGLITGMTAGDSRLTLRVSIENKPRFEVQLGRLHKRFPILNGIKFYHYNEGRRYEVHYAIPNASNPKARE